MAEPIGVLATGARAPGADPPPFDTTVPHPSRMYDYLLGGKDNFAADREAAEQLVAISPATRKAVRENRAFLGRAVRYLAGEAGVRQFLDIGTGIPAADNTHEVAQRIAAGSRTVYVDNDPIVLAHARALLTSAHAGTVSYVDSDLRDLDTILEAARKRLDFGAPVAIMLVMILHLIPDSDDPWRIVRRLVDAVAPGSYLVVSHPARDVQADTVAAITKHVNQLMPATPMTLRRRAEVGRFFGGLDVLPPGLVSQNRWRPDRPVPDDEPDLACYVAVGRKPV
jgi:SAM-dependent methyltransferase